MSILRTITAFSDEEKCMEFLVAKRWPSGIRCVTCGCDRISTITRAAKSRNKRKTIYQCLETSCKQQFTATVGTIFHKSHLPLQKWFVATALIMDAKKGISALQVQRHLGIKSYKSAWHMCHRIRKAMTEAGGLLGGIVEIDETYIGGRTWGKTSKEAKDAKEIVIGIRQREGELRLVHVQDTKIGTMKAVIEANVSKNVEAIMTDDFSSYLWALKDSFPNKHNVIQHKGKKYVRGMVHTNTVENAFSLLKRGIIGNFHFVSAKHLNRYLQEFQFRFNRRSVPLTWLDGTLAKMVQTAPLPYRELTA